MNTHAPEISADYVVLQGARASAVIEARVGEAPLWRYWGPKLPDGCLPMTPLRDGRAVPPSSMEFDQPLSVVPTLGVGWYGQSALLAHRAGQQFAQCFDRCRVEWRIAGKSVAFHLEDSVARILLILTLSIDTNDVLRLQSRLVNVGDDELDVQWLAAGTVPLPGRADEVRSYGGQWANEFLPQREALGRSLWQRQNRRGRGSHDTFPGAVVTLPGSTEHEGLVFGAHLAWSGNHQQTIEWLHDGQFQWQMGEWLAPGELRLPPAAEVTSPVMLASCSSSGMNGLAANFHGAARGILRWPGGAMRPRPVHLNTWEAVYFNHDIQELKALADAAAAIGVERFVLDDGWFHGRRSDRSALGDWWPDEGKYPDGLLPLARHVANLGMEFGLWVEPEMVSPDSELFRAHPDWAMQLAGRPLLTMRNQLVLDVARPEVGDFLFERLDVLLREVPVRYLKWDMNRDLTTAGDASGHAAYRNFVLALYTLLDRIRSAHPEVEIESCASGGARIDFAVLAYTHRVWTSDCNDALSRVGIQRAALQFIPPEVMGAHIGPAPAHTTGRSQSLDFRAAVALPGHLGIEADVRQLDAKQCASLKQWIALYKELRGRLHVGKVWSGEVGDGVVWQAHGDENAREVIVFVYRLAPTTHRYTPALRLPMLDPALVYGIRRIDPTAREATTSPLDDALRGASGGVTAHGAWLAQAGLALPRMFAESAAIYRFVAEFNRGVGTVSNARSDSSRVRY
ncbi:MAG: alpha-galactosidase [Propionivibrio sp.]